MVGTLAVAGAISGLCHVGIFLATKTQIEENRAAALDAAIYRVLPGAKSRKVFALRDGKLAEAEGTKEAAVYGGYDESGRRVGFAVPSDGSGFQDTILVLYGLDPAKRRIVGMEVLESRETPGLGDKIFKDAAFTAQWKDLGFEPSLVPTKPGARSKPNEVDTISGATISSKAVIRIVNDGNAKWLSAILSEAP